MTYGGTDGNLFTQIRARIEDRDRTFAHLPDRGGQRYTYGDVLDVSARFANALVSLGVKPGDRVASQAEKSVEALMLYLATLCAGAVYLPLNPAYTPTEIEHVLNDAEPALFVCDPARADARASVAAAAGARLETLGGRQPPDVVAGSLAEKARAAEPRFDDAARGADDLAAILYTSGTTGRPKGAMLTHGNLASNAEALVDAWRFAADDVLVHALPIFHTHGLFVATNVALLSGAAMILLPRFDLEAILAELPRATVMMGVPTFYTRLLADPRLTRDLVAHMRLFVSGSAPLLPETHRAFRERTGHAILERYGMTETGMNTSNPYDGERRAGTVGFPLAGVEVRITDPETGRALPAGGTGVIEVRGPNVFKGYWRMPERTEAEFRTDGFFVTGDLGRIDPDGCLSIVGRASDLVISGGFNVYPKEIETAIDALPGVVESAVIGVPHPDLGEGVVAIVVGESAGAPDEAEVIAALRERLARYKIPKRVVFVDELPRNAMGKVQKYVLREAHVGLFKPKVSG